jgi:hypothetical protein
MKSRPSEAWPSPRKATADHARPDLVIRLTEDRQGPAR